MNKLLKGDTVAIVAPSGQADNRLLKEGMNVLKSWGLNTLAGQYVFGQQGYFSGSEIERLADFNAAIESEQVKAIFCARGGYGASHIVDQINWKAFQKNPKWIIGFSDITEFLLNSSRLNIPSIHGPMVVQLSKPEYRVSADSLRQLLMEGELLVEANIPVGFPQKGLINGGNLRIIIDSLGTGNEICLQDRVLFIEEVGEPIYKIDRMLTHLERTGKLQGARGVIAGHLTDVADTEPAYECSVHDLISRWAAKNNLPLIQHFGAGHEAHNYPVIFEKEYEIVSDSNSGKMYLRFTL